MEREVRGLVTVVSGIPQINYFFFNIPLQVLNVPNSAKSQDDLEKPWGGGVGASRKQSTNLNFFLSDIVVLRFYKLSLFPYKLENLFIIVAYPFNIIN
jgi:hypothetical protein